MQKPFFSIVIVSLNPGKRLEKTLSSIWNQTFTDYEIVIKDGGSEDESLKWLEKIETDKNKIRMIQKPDCGIYDGMNQAVTYIQGSYVLFLNCGDCFYSDTVLKETAEFIYGDQGKRTKGEILKKDVPRIYYGNQYNQLQDSIVYSVPQINDFACYRNVPCHQVCFYDSRLFAKRAYELKYRVRADYEHFLYSIYAERAKAVSMPIVVASYEGGGFSETAENRKCSAKEHKEIVNKYLGKVKSFRYGAIMCLTLAPLRTKIAESPRFSKFYHKVKNYIYGILNKN